MTDGSLHALEEVGAQVSSCGCRPARLHRHRVLVLDLPHRFDLELLLGESDLRVLEDGELPFFSDEAFRRPHTQGSGPSPAATRPHTSRDIASRVL